MKFIINHLLSFFIGFMFAFCLCMAIEKALIINVDKAYSIGRKEAQQECVELIKQSK